MIQLSSEARLEKFIYQYFHGIHVQIHRLQGDASTRAYFRILANEKSLIAAVYPEQFIASDSSYLSLTTFFQNKHILVPNIVEVCSDLGIILLEDLGNIKLQDHIESLPQNQKIEPYKSAIEMIIHIQISTSSLKDTKLAAAQLAFDEKKLFNELSFFYDNCVVKFLKLDDLYAEKDSVLDEFYAIAQCLAQVPRVLCHRDFHSRNLMWYSKQLWMIDYQDSLMGPATYDLASLLEDPYVDLVDQIKNELKKYFWELQIKNFHSQYYESGKQFEAEYNFMAVQRMLKAVGTFAYQAAVKENFAYVKYIPIALANAGHLLIQIQGLPFTKKLVTTITSALSN